MIPARAARGDECADSSRGLEEPSDEATSVGVNLAAFDPGPRCVRDVGSLVERAQELTERVGGRRSKRMGDPGREAVLGQFSRRSPSPRIKILPELRP